ncbi:MAG: LysR family transcriptional regulator [Chloroflexi bacterium]|nr:LysR family transcriptional regulator [Chloroflexota bacterium]
MLEVHSLHVFLEAARRENFTAAARVLNMSQPGVSMHIKSLEEYLQVSLFERSGRYMRLTKAGQALAPMAQQIIEMTIHAEETIREANGKVVGDLVIGSSAPTANYLMPQIIARFRRIYPNVRVSIPVVSQQELLDHLQRNEYDFGLTSDSVPCRDYPCSHFFDDELVLIAPKAHPWAKRQHVEPEQLVEEDFVCQAKHSGCRQAVGEHLEKLHVDINKFSIVMEIDSPEALAVAVESGLGLSFVSALAAYPHAALGKLAIIPVNGLQVRNPIHLLESPVRCASPVQMKFKSFIDHPQTRSFVELLLEGHL